MTEALLMTAGGSGFMLLMTCLGSAVALMFKREINASLQRFLIGFSAGVMTAASIWSMIIPSINEMDGRPLPWLPAAGGILIGAGFIMVTDALISKYKFGNEITNIDSERKKRNKLLILAVTLHNIPEGMAVGLAFALASSYGGEYTAALTLALCIGIQNFPEGAAISLPLRRDGMSPKKAVFKGAMTGIVEPPAAILTVLTASVMSHAMPWLLGFAAGAMIYVTIEELVPESHGCNKSGTIGVMAGFVLMLIFDVALG